MNCPKCNTSSNLIAVVGRESGETAFICKTCKIVYNNNNKNATRENVESSVLLVAIRYLEDNFLGHPDKDSSSPFNCKNCFSSLEETRQMNRHSLIVCHLCLSLMWVLSEGLILVTREEFKRLPKETKRRLNKERKYAYHLKTPNSHTLITLPNNKLDTRLVN